MAVASLEEEQDKVDQVQSHKFIIKTSVTGYLAKLDKNILYKEDCDAEECRDACVSQSVTLIGHFCSVFWTGQSDCHLFLLFKGPEVK